MTPAVVVTRQVQTGVVDRLLIVLMLMVDLLLTVTQ
jgi:hypothetical protein